MKNTYFHNIYYPERKEKCTRNIWKQGMSDGLGVLECFDVAPGIQLCYSDLQMDSCYQTMIPEHDFLQIDHCLEGCYEFEMLGGAVSFLGEGDLSVTNICKGKQMFFGSRIPLKKYRGITILLEIETAQKTLNTGFQQANIDISKIRDTLCLDGRALLIKSKHEIDHIFSELYHVDESIRLPYFWIKVIELLLYLSQLDSSYVKKDQHFSEEVSAGTKEVYRYIIENPLVPKTIAELSGAFHVAESSLKRCFLSLTGHSIGNFMRIKRMEAAAQMLVCEPQKSILEVALAVGYENQSKFGAAFKSVFGVAPLAYRKKSK